MSQNQINKIIKILIIEDEQAIRDMLMFALKPLGYEILEAECVLTAERILKMFVPDLILVDWMLPGTSGIDFVKQIRTSKLSWREIPIIMLTARAEEWNKVTGLSHGADDYITKPFSPKELDARIRTVLRRSNKKEQEPNNKLQFEQYIMNPNLLSISDGKNSVSLSLQEFELLTLFLNYPNRAFTRNQLLEKVWSQDGDVTDRSVDAAIKRLRRKISSFDLAKQIETLYGVGYIFRKDVNL